MLENISTNKRGVRKKLDDLAPLFYDGFNLPGVDVFTVQDEKYVCFYSNNFVYKTFL